MQQEKLVEMYRQRGMDEDAIARAVSAAEAAEQYFTDNGIGLKQAGADDIQQYVQTLMDAGENDVESLLAVARYTYLIGNREAYIHFTKLLGGIGVVENIRARTARFAGDDTANAVFIDLPQVPVGTLPSDVPPYTAELMTRLKRHMPEESYRRALAGNNHGISEAAMTAEKAAYERSASLDEYLRGRHQRNVAQLQSHADSGQVWFEQIITQDVVDYVKTNQEILSAVHRGGRLYVTKIPYDAVNYLKEQDPLMRRYYACHCPLARESIRSGRPVDGDWCYCSGGFAKFPFEVIFGRELSVKVLQSALTGDGICRFEIGLGEETDEHERR